MLIPLVLAVTAFAAALGFNGPGANLLLLAYSGSALLLWAGLLAWRDLSTRNLQLPSGRGPAIMAAMFAWMLLSIFWSDWQQISFFYAFIVGALPLCFLLWLKQPNPDAFWDRLWIALLLLGIGAAVWGLTEYTQGTLRPDGPFIDANAYGALFYVLLFPAFFRYLTLRTGSRRAVLSARSYELAIGVLLAALFTTHSRGAIGALILLLPLALAGALRHYGKAAVPALLTMAAIGAGAYAAVIAYPEQSVDRPVFELSEDRSTHARLKMWRATWEIYKDNPILGTGVGTYKSQYAAYRDPTERATTGDLAHNDYLQLLQEGGPLLLGLLLATGVMTLFLLWRCFRLCGNEKLDRARGDRIMESFGLLLGVVALFMHATVNFILYVLPLSMLAGLYLGRAYRQCLEVEQRRLELSLRPGVARAALVTIIAIPVSVLTIDGVTAAVLLRQPPVALSAALAPDMPRAYAFAQTMAALRPGNVVPTLYLAQVNQELSGTSGDPALRRTAAARAAEEYTRALNVAPRDAYALTELARVLIDNPWLKPRIKGSLPNDPEELLGRALRIRPSYEAAYLALARLYRERGETERAYMLLSQEAMLWFTVGHGSQEHRIEITELALELAIELNYRAAIGALASNLLANVPDHPAARKALEHLQEQGG